VLIEKMVEELEKERSRTPQAGARERILVRRTREGQKVVAGIVAKGGRTFGQGRASRMQPEKHHFLALAVRKTFPLPSPRRHAKTANQLQLVAGVISEVAKAKAFPISATSFLPRPPLFI